MKFTSTRNSSLRISAAEAIVKGISDDGGLFVPVEFPDLSFGEIEKMCDWSYQQRAAYILKKYLDEFTLDELNEFTEKAYSRFDDGDAAPLAKVDENLYMLELWHGPTSAFKDLALTMLPHLLVASKKKLGREEKTLILVATSGDTGKAALEGFKDIDGTEIMVFYPESGVSDMQKLQMLTQEGKNVKVIGIKGNFDDAQTAVKKIFTDKNFENKIVEKGYKMSSANSINWGRLAPQIAYYISSYVDLIASEEISLGDKIDFVVPTGNFGNILAAFYAYKMGLPVGKLIVASNTNNVLSDFFHEGKYSTNRDFYKTISPSMDILISSNLERLIYEMYDRDDAKINEIYDSLKEKGEFEIDFSMIKRSIFEAGWADEAETNEAIANFYDLYDCPIDPHTAVAMSVYTDYVDETGVEVPTVVVSTASPYKFAVDVYKTIGLTKVTDPFKAINFIELESAMEAPKAIKGLKNKPILHDDIIEKDKIADAVLNNLK